MGEGSRCPAPAGKVSQMRRDFSTDGIHPRTLRDVEPGMPVVVRDAWGALNERVATSGVTRGADFVVIWVARRDEWEAARREGRVAEQVPWPAEDVWLPEDAPASGEGEPS